MNTLQIAEKTIKDLSIITTTEIENLINQNICSPQEMQELINRTNEVLQKLECNIKSRKNQKILKSKDSEVRILVYQYFTYVLEIASKYYPNKSFKEELVVLLSYNSEAIYDISETIIYVNHLAKNNKIDVYKYKELYLKLRGIEKFIGRLVYLGVGEDMCYLHNMINFKHNLKTYIDDEKALTELLERLR